MTRIFADACYWIALLNRKDQLHLAATTAQKRLKKSHFVTTDEVLTEVLNFYSSRGKEIRNATAMTVEAIRKDSRVTVVEQSRTTFDGGFARYKRDTDKQYSLADCVSFELMTQDGMSQALTDDHHFEQAGFVALLKGVNS